MKEGWQLKELGDLCKIIGGGTPPKDKPHYYAGVIPWATVRDMRQESLTDTEYKITDEAVRKSSTNIIPANNVVIAMRVGLGKVCLIQQDTAINQDLRAIIPKNPKQVSVKYLFWWFKSVARQIEDEGTGATVKGVKLPFIRSLSVPLPPLEEQERIVDTLDKAFAAIDAAKTITDKNKKLSTAAFEAALDEIAAMSKAQWGFEALSKVVESVSTGPFGSLLHKSDYEPGGIPLVNPINILGDTIVPDKRKAVSATTAKRLTNYVLKENDIVIARRGEIGRCAVVTEAEAGWICGTGSFFIRPSEKLDPVFLAYLFRSKPYRQILESASDRATMPSISNKYLASLKVAVPPINEQKLYVAELQKISIRTTSLRGTYIRKQAGLDELKQSILAKAFSGGLGKS